MREFPRDTSTKVWQGDRGSWRGATRDGQRTATVWCPECGRPASLSEHIIRADGLVTPSLKCPYDPAPGCTQCTFHEHVRLLGWQP